MIFVTSYNYFPYCWCYRWSLTYIVLILKEYMPTRCFSLMGQNFQMAYKGCYYFVCIYKNMNPRYELTPYVDSKWHLVVSIKYSVTLLVSPTDSRRNISSCFFLAFKSNNAWKSMKTLLSTQNDNGIYLHYKHKRLTQTSAFQVILTLD